mmetsp:Transcript_14006/g.41361  ORF Transcript_14006/g.41361 Transcript_14006/m.41361 type:complete len:455 (-) Transcript_14006:235-1599(-)
MAQIEPQHQFPQSLASEASLSGRLEQRAHGFPPFELRAVRVQRGRPRGAERRTLRPLGPLGPLGRRLVGRRGGGPLPKDRVQLGGVACRGAGPIHHLRNHGVQTSRVGRAAGADAARAQRPHHAGHVDAGVALHLAAGLQRQAAVELLRLLARADHHARRAAEHAPLKERERRVQAGQRAVLADPLHECLCEQHRVTQGLVCALRLEGRHWMRRVANQGDAVLRGRPPRKAWLASTRARTRPQHRRLEHLSVVDWVARHAVERRVGQQGRDGVVPPPATAEEFGLEGGGVLGQRARSLLGAGEGELPHGRAGREGHGVETGGAVHRLEDAALRERDGAVEDAEHHHKPDVVEAVAGHRELPPHRREDPVRAHEQRRIEGGAVGKGDGHARPASALEGAQLAAPPDRPGAELLDDPRAQLLARDVDEAARGVALAPHLALVAERLAEEAEDGAVG